MTVTPPDENHHGVKQATTEPRLSISRARCSRYATARHWLCAAPPYDYTRVDL